MDYYLRADTEQALWTALVDAGAAMAYSVKDEHGNVVDTRYSAKAGYDIDIIGTIYKPTGNLIQQTFDGRTQEIPEMIALDGFHANLRGPVDLAGTVEISIYQPTAEDLANPEFVMPEPQRTVTASPLAALLVYPQQPVRTWF